MPPECRKRLWGRSSVSPQGGNSRRGRKNPIVCLRHQLTRLCAGSGRLGNSQDVMCNAPSRSRLTQADPVPILGMGFTGMETRMIGVAGADHLTEGSA